MNDASDSLPDRVAHRRRVAAKLNHDHREFAADDESRRANTVNRWHRVSNPVSGADNRGSRH